jgi:hypothetical protein
LSRDSTNLDYESHDDTRQRRRRLTAWGMRKWLIVACAVGFLAIKFLGF